MNYVQRYSQIVVPMFKLIKKDVNFVWDKDCQQAFEVLKKTPVDIPILV
jgi:hypothetical protein